MKHRDVVTFLVAAVFGAAIWISSPFITGHDEPWDADGIIYVGALAVTGLFAGLVSPKPLWAHYCGNVIGQLSYEILILGMPPFFLLGLGFLLAYGLVFVAAASAAASLRAFLDSR